MRITTKAVYDIETWSLIEWEGYEYDGPIEECKSSNSANEMNTANTNQAQQMQLMKQQLGLTNNAIGSMLGANQQLLGQGSSALSGIGNMIQNGGFLPGQQQGLQAQALNAIGNNYSSGMRQLNNMLAARGLTGGMNAGGGGVGQGFGQLIASQGNQMQGAVGGIQQIGSQQLLSALGQGLGAYSQGVNNIGNAAGMYSGLTGNFNQGGLGYMNSGVTAANNADQANTSWMGPVFGALGAVGGGLAGR